MFHSHCGSIPTASAQLSYTYTVRRYAITSRALFSGPDDRRRSALVQQAALWAAEGVEFIQLREKDLGAGQLAELARRMLEQLHSSRTRLLINSRADIAVTTGAHGVHLTSAPGQLTPAQVREVYEACSLPRPVVSVSCHSLAEVEQARRNQADILLFGPVFEKSVAGQLIAPGEGLETLKAACAFAAPAAVFALGGVTLENAADCLSAGAAGIAGIRLFHDLPEQRDKL